MILRFLAIALVCLAVSAHPVRASGGGDDGHGGKKKEKKSEGGSAAKHQKQITTLESWVSVYPIAVSIVQDDKVRGQIQVWFGMDVPDATLRARAEELMPRLRDAWLTRISQFASTSARVRKPANIDDMSRLLQTTADQMLGKPGSRVLIGSVIVTMR
jgi:hypothetical protein